MSLVIASAASAVADAPTVPSNVGGPYVVAAYVVFIVVIAAYVAIMAQRLRRVSRQADELTARLDAAEGKVNAAAPAAAAAVATPPAEVPVEAPAAGASS